MTTYTVKDISKLLAVDEETVRRWIRSDRLKTTLASKKTGNVITLDAFNKFLMETPKYASKMVTSPAGLSFLVGGIIGGVIATLYKKRKTSVDEDDVKELLSKKIETCRKSIVKKQQQIATLEEEIKEEEFEIKKYELAMSNLDFKMVAEQINENL
ncbi:MAG: helix-turn-helix domain-containing protein [Clostridia bacterium]|nr:helix-turn-helix domain-containing protein [Clostridia bacterium]